MFTVSLMFLGIFSTSIKSIVTGDTPDFTVRLLNPFRNNSKEGRLEIYYSGTWGTICDDLFTDVSASVACASLGFSYGTVIANRYGVGIDPIWLDDVNCTGTESGLEQCSHTHWGMHNCSHSKDVSISCACGNRYFSGPTGIIKSPNFPMEYADNLDCYNYISVMSGQATVITFSAFSTEKCCDWVTITCESGQAFTSPRYSGLQFPAILAISSCQLVKVSFHTDGYVVSSGFNITYSVSSGTVIGGFTTKPTNAFPRLDKNDTVIFNCTSRTKYLAWWTINSKSSGNYTVTNSSCGVITSASYSYWFKTETLGPGSCNLILDAPGSVLRQLAGSLVCTDVTLASARALIVPISLQLNVTKGTNSSSTITDLLRDEEVTISCIPFFIDQSSSPTLIFTYFIYSGGPVVQVRISRNYWTSQGKTVSSINTFTSTYVLVKATTYEIPRYTCNIVCDLFSNVSDMIGGYSIEISESTEPFKVLFWPAEQDMILIGQNNGRIRFPGVLSCYVPANPPATYKWIDESDGNITNGQIITVIHGGKYTCSASNFIRGQYYQQSKSTEVAVQEEDDTHPLNIPAIILGALLGVAVLMIIIILATLLIRNCRQQKTNVPSGVGHVNRGNEQELQQGGRRNCYDTSIGNPACSVAEEDYESLDASERPLPTTPAIYLGPGIYQGPAIYQGLTNRK